MHEYRKLNKKQWTSLITNFDDEPINSIKIFTIEEDKSENATERSDVSSRNESKAEDDKNDDNETKVEEVKRGRGRPKGTTKGGTPSTTPLAYAADDIVSFNYDENILFAGLIDIVNDSSNYNNLLQKL